MNDVTLMKTTIKRCLEVGIVPFIWGKHGIGKSEIVHQIAEEMGYDGVFDLRLGAMADVGDLTGMPEREYFCPSCNFSYGTRGDLIFCPMCEEKGNKVPIKGRTIFLPPYWLPYDGKKYLLFFDEVNRGRLDILQVFFQISLDHRSGSHIIPDNYGIICAGNPSGADYNVEELDPALINRLGNIKFTLERKDWLKWAEENKLHEDVIDFVKTDTKQLGNEAIDIPIEIKPSPRGMAFLSKIINGTNPPHTILDKSLWIPVANMIIGESAALAFQASLKTDIEKPLKAEEVFKKFHDVKVQRKFKAQLKDSEGEIRFDLLRLTLDDVKDKLQKESAKYSEKELNNFADFLVEIPTDLSFSAIKEIANINDVNERLLLKRNDLFELLKKARKSD